MHTSSIIMSVCVCVYTHTYKQSKTNQEHQANTPPRENNQLNQADNAQVNTTTRILKSLNSVKNTSKKTHATKSSHNLRLVYYNILNSLGIHT